MPALKLVGNGDGFWERVRSSSWISRIRAALSTAMMLCIIVAGSSLQYKSASPADHSEQFPQLHGLLRLLKGKLTFSHHDQSPDSPHPDEDKRRIF